MFASYKSQSTGNRKKTDDIITSYIYMITSCVPWNLPVHFVSSQE